MSPIREDDLRSLLRDHPYAADHDDAGLAAAVSARGRRIIRRRRIIGGIAGVAAVAAVAVGVSTLDLGPREALVPGGPTTTASVVATETGPAPAVTTPLADEPTSPGPTGEVDERPLPRLLHEGISYAELEAASPGTYVGEGPFETSTGIEADFRPCELDGVPLPLPAGDRIDSKAISQTYGSGDRAEGLTVFGSAEEAVKAMTAIRERLDCAGSAGVVSSTWALDGSWGDGVGATVASEGRGFTSYYYLARVGRGIMWTSNSGDGGVETNPPAPAIDEMLREPLEHLYPSMCRFTEAGC